MENRSAWRWSPHRYALEIGLSLLVLAWAAAGHAAGPPPDPEAIAPPGGWPVANKSLDCDVAPLTIEFGPTPVFETETRYYRVVNQTAADLVLDPTSDLSGFTPAPGPITVAAGDTVYSWITFEASLADTSYGTVDLGPQACSTISCVGIRQTSGEQEEDVIGITFDPATLEFGMFDPTIDVWPHTVVSATLALVNPSREASLAGWECCLGIEGGAVLVSFQGDGGPINVLTPPCYMVGLQSPLPPAPYHILGTFQIFVTDVSAPIVLSLDPVYYASIPDRMCWLTGGEDGQLVPMATAYGTPEVAVIEAHPLSGVGDAPQPRTRLLQNVPNPFNPRTAIRFETELAGRVRIDLFDAAGRHVRTLLDERREAGPYSIDWNGADGAGRSLASGTYSVKLTTSGGVDARKVTLLR